MNNNEDDDVTGELPFFDKDGNATDHLAAKINMRGPTIFTAIVFGIVASLIILLALWATVEIIMQIVEAIKGKC